MAITFSKSSKSTKTVNRVLDSILPGHTTTSAIKPSSSSQIINSTQKKLKPEVIRRQRKKEKLEQRSAVQKESKAREDVESKARYQVLMQHAKEDSLTPEEKKELKRLVKKNVTSVQSWRLEDEEDLKEIQKEIMELKKSEYTRVKRRPTANKKLEAGQLYKRKQETRFPGLTPGLAPVGLEDSDSDDD